MRSGGGNWVGEEVASCGHHINSSEMCLCCYANNGGRYSNDRGWARDGGSSGCTCHAGLLVQIASQSYRAACSQYKEAWEDRKDSYTWPGTPRANCAVDEPCTSVYGWAKLQVLGSLPAVQAMR